jgi:TPR repeat protein
MGVRVLSYIAIVLLAAAIAVSMATQTDARLFWVVKRVAERGDPLAQYDLAVLYANGKGVASNEVESLRWIKKAAENGEPKSQNVLGLYCTTGEHGVPKNEMEAVRLFRKSAEQGWAEGEFNFAACYLKGRGVEKDVGEAVKWLRTAANQGHANAQYHLAYVYLTGVRGETNQAEAVVWLRKAADSGLGIAEFNLGMAYATGAGVAQDYVQSHKWVSLAVAQGKGDKAALPALEEKMTPQQIAEAQKQARDFRPRKESYSGMCFAMPERL